eukprot:Gb_12413 [translate_table: standard]
MAMGMDETNAEESDDQCSVKSDESGSNRVKFLCSHGGKILPRPGDGKLRYVGGETRVVAASRSITFADFIAKMGEVCGSSVSLKYQLPSEDLDALVSVTSNEDLENMLEEYERFEAKEGASKVRIFLFPARISMGDKAVDGAYGVPATLKPSASAAGGHMDDQILVDVLREVDVNKRVIQPPIKRGDGKRLTSSDVACSNPHELIRPMAVHTHISHWQAREEQPQHGYLQRVSGRPKFQPHFIQSAATPYGPVVQQLPAQQSCPRGACLSQQHIRTVSAISHCEGTNVGRPPCVPRQQKTPFRYAIRSAPTPPQLKPVGRVGPPAFMDAYVDGRFAYVDSSSTHVVYNGLPPVQVRFPGRAQYTVSGRIHPVEECVKGAQQYVRVTETQNPYHQGFACPEGTFCS